MKLGVRKVLFLFVISVGVLQAQTIYEIRRAVKSFNKDNPEISIKSGDIYDRRRAQLGKDYPSFEVVTTKLALEGKPSTWIFGYTSEERAGLKEHVIDLLIEIRNRARTWNTRAAIVSIFRSYENDAAYLGENMPPKIVVDRALKMFDMTEDWLVKNSKFIEPRTELLKKEITVTDAFLDPLYDYVSLAVAEEQVRAGLPRSKNIEHLAWEYELDVPMSLTYEDRWKLVNTLMKCRQLKIKSRNLYVRHVRESGLEPYKWLTQALESDPRYLNEHGEVDWPRIFSDDNPDYSRELVDKNIAIIRQHEIKSTETFRKEGPTLGLNDYETFKQHVIVDGRYADTQGEVDWNEIFDRTGPKVKKLIPKTAQEIDAMLKTIRKAKIKSTLAYEEKYKSLGLPAYETLKRYLELDGRYLKADKSGVDWTYAFTGKRAVAMQLRLMNIHRAVLKLDIVKVEEYAEQSKSRSDFVSVTTLKELIRGDSQKRFVKKDNSIDWEKFFGTPGKIRKKIQASIDGIRKHGIKTSSQHEAAWKNLTNIINRTTMREWILEYDTEKKYIKADSEVNWDKIYFGDDYVSKRMDSAQEIIHAARDEFGVRSSEGYKELSQANPERFPNIKILSSKVKALGVYPTKTNGEIDWVKIFSSNSGFMSAGLGDIFAKGGLVERVVNEVASMLVDPQTLVALEELGPEHQAKLKRLPKVMQDRIYRFYHKTREIFPELGVDPTFALAINLASVSLGEAASENYEENLKTFERYYVAEFERMLELKNGLTAVLKEQVGFLAALYAIAVAKYVNAGYSIPEAMVRGFAAITTPQGIAGLFGFVVTSKAVGDIGKIKALELIRGKRITVAQAQRLLKLISFVSVGLGMISQQAIENYLNIQTVNRVGNVAHNVGYMRMDMSGQGLMNIQDYFEEPVAPDLGAIYQAYDDIGLKITTDRSVLAQMGELEYHLVTRPIYRTEALQKQTPGTYIAQKMGLQSASVMKNSAVALSRINVIDVLAHTGILMVGSYFGSQVPWAGTIVTLTIAGGLAEQYEQIRHGIDTAADFTDYVNEIESLVDRDEMNAYRMREAFYRQDNLLTPSWVKTNLEKRAQAMNFQRSAWREEIQKQEYTIFAAYQAVYRTTLEFMRSRPASAREIARQTILGLKAYGEGRLPEHEIEPILTFLHRMYYAHQALERLMEVPWLNSLKGAGCRSALGCLSLILYKDEIQISQRPLSRREFDESAMARIPLQLVLQDEHAYGIQALNVRDHMRKFKESQAAIVAVEPMVQAFYDAMLGIEDHKTIKPKQEQPIAAVRNGNLEITGLLKGTYEVNIVASADKGQNTGTKPHQEKRAHLSTMKVEEEAIQSLRIPETLLKFCKARRCYLQVVDTSTSKTISSLNISI